jgi:hypothetical protein
LLAGCVLGGDDTAEPDEEGSHESLIQSDNGKSLNGVSLNGISLNGTSLNGVSLNGISLNGTTLAGVSLSGTTLNGATMTALAVGSKWTAALSNGQSLPMRVDSAAKGTGTNADVGMYGVSYQTSGGWQRLCGSNTDGTAVLALAVAGVWNQQSGVIGNGAYSTSSTQYTWACRGKTIAKCVELGYKPWTNRQTQLATCVRLLRGDYCGDGTANTVDGQQLNVYDNAGIQTDTMAWDKEAEWTQYGARCLSSKGEARFVQLKLTRPWCSGFLPTTSTCGNNFSSGAVMISEYAGAGYVAP